jgi:precorrin-2 methylase
MFVLLLTTVLFAPNNVQTSFQVTVIPGFTSLAACNMAGAAAVAQTAQNRALRRVASCLSQEVKSKNAEARP